MPPTGHVIPTVVVEQLPPDQSLLGLQSAQVWGELPDRYARIRAQLSAHGALLAAVAKWFKANQS